MRKIHWLKSKGYPALITLVFMACGMQASAYTVIQGPPTLESGLIASATNQYNATLTANPFFPGTYQIQLISTNAAYNPPVTNQALLNALVSVSTQNYVYGWADGIDWQRWHTLGFFNNQFDSSRNYVVNCSSPSYWNSLQVSTSAFPLVSIDSTTCMAILSGVYNDIYNEFFSTPPAPVPPQQDPMPLGQ